jgi:hypothetical protein
MFMHERRRTGRAGVFAWCRSCGAGGTAAPFEEDGPLRPPGWAACDPLTCRNRYGLRDSSPRRHALVPLSAALLADRRCPRYGKFMTGKASVPARCSRRTRRKQPSSRDADDVAAVTAGSSPSVARAHLVVAVCRRCEAGGTKGFARRPGLPIARGRRMNARSVNEVVEPAGRVAAPRRASAPAVHGGRRAGKGRGPSMSSPPESGTAYASTALHRPVLGPRASTGTAFEPRGGPTRRHGFHAAAHLPRARVAPRGRSNRSRGPLPGPHQSRKNTT